MSDAYTEVVAGGKAALGMWGYIDPATAIRDVSRYWLRQLEEAQRFIAAIDAGDVQVFHQRGPYAATNRREVTS